MAENGLPGTEREIAPWDPSPAGRQERHTAMAGDQTGPHPQAGSPAVPSARQHSRLRYI